MGNWFVGYDANERRIHAKNTNMKLEDQLKNAIRLKHFSLRTEESYVGWYRRYVLWHGKKHPGEMGEAEVAITICPTPDCQSRRKSKSGSSWKLVREWALNASTTGGVTADRREPAHMGVAS